MTITRHSAIHFVLQVSFLSEHPVSLTALVEFTATATGSASTTRLGSGGGVAPPASSGPFALPVHCVAAEGVLTSAPYLDSKRGMLAVDAVSRRFILSTFQGV
jgi:hypothetical protein